MSEATRKYQRDWKRARRKEILDEIFNVLGARCTLCGYDVDRRALQIDHIGGGGNEERKLFSDDVSGYYSYILEHINSGKYRILCANCNAIGAIENHKRYWEK